MDTYLHMHPVLLESAVPGWVSGQALAVNGADNGSSSTKEVRTGPSTANTREGELNHSTQTDEHNYYIVIAPTFMVGAPRLKSLSIRITRSKTAFVSPELRPDTSSIMNILGRLLTM
eukprot:15469554-Alexandrium_andersonii.AAC.2